MELISKRYQDFSVQDELNIEYNPEEWRLFIDSSKLSLKAVLLHNGNTKPSIHVVHSVAMKETYEKMSVILIAVISFAVTWQVESLPFNPAARVLFPEGSEILISILGLGVCRLSSVLYSLWRWLSHCTDHTIGEAHSCTERLGQVDRNKGDFTVHC